MTIQIGPITLSDPVILAPMSGVTDLPFRRLVKRAGCGLVVSEMIASQAMIRENRQTLRMIETEAEEFPMSVQLAGCEPDVMAEAARINEARGAVLIDINFGCPVKKVVNGHAGSALMRDEALAGRILEATAKAVSIPVTMKMRLGWDVDCLNAPRLARIAEECGIRMITVHGRTRNQFYHGTANWDLIAEVKQATTLPLIANGDINSFEAVDQALAKSRADGVMIGRGAYGRPWFPARIAHYLRTGEKLPDPSLTQQRDILLEHYDAMLTHYGVDGGIRVSRKHISWYSNGLRDSADFRSEVNRLGDPEAVKQLINKFYALAIEAAAAGGTALDMPAADQPASEREAA